LAARNAGTLVSLPVLNYFQRFPAFAPRNQGCYPLNRRMDLFSN